MTTEILAIISIVLILAGGAFIYFNTQQRQDKLRLAEQQKLSYPLRLQAYERMLLFLERIKPQSLLTRINLDQLPPTQLQQVILNEIRTELHHNAAQQLYISKETWDKITFAANQTSARLVQSINEKTKFADSKAIVIELLQNEDHQALNAINLAIDAIKTEAQKNF